MVRRAALISSIVVLLGSVAGLGMPIGFHVASSTLKAPRLSQAQRLAATSGTRFESNRGQTDARVRFLARGPGSTLFLTRRQAVLAPSAGGAAVRTLFVRANQNPKIVGIDRLPGRTNYFIGAHPATWHTGILSFGAVEYRSLYPGVDLRFHAGSAEPEYDFVVKPGADPSAIALRIEGAEHVALDGRGNLDLSLGSGSLVERAPTIYQDVDGTRRLVAGRFALLGPDVVGFALASYDRTLPLVIDPTLVYSTYLGGNGDDEADAVAVDAAGDAFVVGKSRSTNFPTTAGSFQPSYAGADDLFVTKFDPTGTPLWSTYVGGSKYEFPTGIAVDASGSAYITGGTCSSDFPVTPDAYDTTVWAVDCSPPRGPPATEAFVTKLDPTGSALAYSTLFPVLEGDAIAVDRSGSAYITGSTNGFDFPTTQGAYQFLCQDYCAFVTKFDPSGSTLGYSTYVGTDSEGEGVAVDASGEAYVTGFADTPLVFPTTIGAAQTMCHGENDSFVSKLDASGGRLLYSTLLGGSSLDLAAGIALDSSGNAYVTGDTYSSDFPTTAGAFQRKDLSGLDAFVTKVQPVAFRPFAYSTYLGGTTAGTTGADYTEGFGIAVDPKGRAYVTGLTFSPSFPVTAGAFQPVRAGSEDAFVSALNPAGSKLAYSSYLGGSTPGGEQGRGIAAVSGPAAIVVGDTVSTDFPVTPGAFQTTLASTGTQYAASDAFVTKIG